MLWILKCFRLCYCETHCEIPHQHLDTLRHKTRKIKVVKVTTRYDKKMAQWVSKQLFWISRCQVVIITENPSKAGSWLINLWTMSRLTLYSVCVKLLSSLPVRPTFFRQEKQRFFFLFLSGVWSLSDKACAPSPTGSGGEKRHTSTMVTNQVTIYLFKNKLVYNATTKKHPKEDIDKI